MATAVTSLAHRHIFGVNVDVTANVSFTTEDMVVYVAGHSLVLYNLTDRRQRFINGAEITDSITAFCCGSGRRLAAVAERGERPQVHIFDLRTFRRKKTIAASEGSSKEFVSVAFSEDDQLLLTLSGAPDYTLSCWNWAKAKVVAATQASPYGHPVYQCIFSPIDVSIFVVVGKEYVRFFRQADKEMRLLQETHMPEQNFTCSCWMRTPDDHLLVGTESGDVLLFRAGMFVMMLPCAPGPSRGGMPCTSMISMPGGFIVGSGPAELFFYAYDNSRDQALFDDQFTLVHSVTTDLSEGTVLHIAMCPLEEKLCVLTSDGQLLSLPCISPKSVLPEHIKYTSSAFHGPKSIVGMDVCVRKPLIITVCKDQTLRIWNFSTHECEMHKVFPEDMFSAALHPTGLHCTVGFTDKLRIYHVLVDELRICMELPIKACKECRFSNGGDMFAAANGSTISVYEFYTGEKVTDLRGHNGKVRSLQWLESGALLSCGQDGTVYMWNVPEARRTGEFVQKGTVFLSATHCGESVFVVGNDRSLRELAMPDLAPHRNQDAGLLLGQVTLSVSKSVLFAGSNDHNRPGCIRAYTFPITGDFDDYPCGSRHVTRLRLTPDECFIISADDAGCITIFELKDRQDRFQRTANATAPPDLLVLEDWSDEILITKNELDEKSQQITELRNKVDELKLHNEYQLKLKEMNYSEKIKEATDKYVQELEQAKTKLELLKEECADLELEHEERVKQMTDKHQSNVQEMETAFQVEIMDCVNAFQQLTRDRDAQIERLEAQRRALVTAHERYVEELTLDYEQKLDDDRHTRLQCEDDKLELEREIVEIQSQLEDDVDVEIDNLRKTYEERLTSSRETTLKYKGENSIMRKKFSVLQRDLEDMKEETRRLLDQEKELHDSIRLLEKEVSAHKKEIKARDVSIGEKEKRIYELKKKNQELDKFKFVLDFKIRELKRQIEPRQLEIAGMRDKIKDMDAELERFHKSNASLDSMIGTVRERIDELQAETRLKRMHAKQQENNIAAFRSDLQLAIAFILDPVALRQAIEQIVRDHGSSGVVKPRIDADVEGEYARHKEFLQRSILQLKKALEDGAQQHLATNGGLMQDNLKLIGEINKQRSSNRALRGEVQADIGRIRQMAQAKEINKRKKGGGEGGVMEMSLLENNDGGAGGGQEDVDPANILEKNRRRILALRAAIAELENRRLMDGGSGAGVNSAYVRGDALPDIVLPAVEPRIAFYTQAQGAADLASPRPATDEPPTNTSAAAAAYSSGANLGEGSVMGDELDSPRLELPPISSS